MTTFTAPVPTSISPVFDAETRLAIFRVYQSAESCQDACNLSGVAISFADVVRVVRIEAEGFGQGTDYVNRHPVVALYLSKMLDLNGEFPPCDHYGKAARAVGFVRCLGADGIGSPEHRDVIARHRAGTI